MTFERRSAPRAREEVARPHVDGGGAEALRERVCERLRRGRSGDAEVDDGDAARGEGERERRAIDGVERAPRAKPALHVEGRPDAQRPFDGDGRDEGPRQGGRVEGEGLAPRDVEEGRELRRARVEGPLVARSGAALGERSQRRRERLGEGPCGDGAGAREEVHEGRVMSHVVARERVVQLR